MDNHQDEIQNEKPLFEKIDYSKYTKFQGEKLDEALNTNEEYIFSLYQKFVDPEAYEMDADRVNELCNVYAGLLNLPVPTEREKAAVRAVLGKEITKKNEQIIEKARKDAEEAAESRLIADRTLFKQYLAHFAVPANGDQWRELAAVQLLLAVQFGIAVPRLAGITGMKRLNTADTIAFEMQYSQKIEQKLGVLYERDAAALRETLPDSKVFDYSFPHTEEEEAARATLPESARKRSRTTTSTIRASTNFRRGLQRSTAFRLTIVEEQRTV